MEQEGIRSNSQENLHSTLQLIPEFSAFMGTPLLPPSHTTNQKISMDEFEEQYPVRYHLWGELKDLRTDYSKETLQRIKRVGKYLHVLNSLDDYVSSHHVDKKTGDQTLWDEQFSVFESIRYGLEQGETDGYIKLPTGTGKTVLFTEFIEALGLETKFGEGIKSLIVVPSTIPIGQTEKALKEFAEAIPFGKVYSNQKDIGEKEQPVTIITDESLQIQINEGNINPLDYDLLILDEVHKYLTPSKMEAIKKFANAVRLGFTATPTYSEQKNVKNLLLPYEYASMSVKEAVEKEMLCSFSAILAKCDIDISNVALEGTLNEYKRDELENQIDVKELNDKVAEFYSDAFKDEVGIVFCAGVNHAQHVAQSFNERGITAGFISGYMTDTEKVEAQRQLRDGEIKVLCNADILIESFDNPLASVCINLRPTMSAVVAEQRGGRVLRLDKDNPEKHATIVDFLYSNSNKNSQQVLYSEVAQAAEVYGKTQKKSSSSEKGKYTPREAIKIEGLEITINPEEVLRITNEHQLSKQLEILPSSGWMNLTELSKLTGRSITGIIQFMNSLTETNPESVQLFKTSRSHLVKYFHPSIVKTVLEKYPPPQRAPEGWISETAAATLLGYDRRVVRKYANQLASGNTENMGRFLSLKNIPSYYYSKELLDRIKNMDKVPRPDPNWTPINRIVTKFHTNAETVFELAQRLAAEHPEWIKETQAEGKIYRTLQKPLAELVDAELTKIQKPDEYRTMYDVAESLKITYDTVSRSSIELEKEHPEWFITARSDKGVLLKMLHPDAVREIQTIRAELEPPKGYFTSKEAAQYLKRMPVTVKKHALRLAKQFPGEVIIKPTAHNALPEAFYSPRIIEMLEAEYKKIAPAPEGWMTFGAYRSSRGYSAQWKSPLAQAATLHPEWFGKYYDSKNREQDFISPEGIAFLNTTYPKL